MATEDRSGGVVLQDEAIIMTLPGTTGLTETELLRETDHGKGRSTQHRNKYELSCLSVYRNLVIKLLNSLNKNSMIVKDRKF